MNWDWYLLGVLETEEQTIFVRWVRQSWTHDPLFFSQNFDSDISSVGIDGCWQADSQRLLNEVMVEHFFRQGMLDVAEELCQVSVCLRETAEGKLGSPRWRCLQSGVQVFCGLLIDLKKYFNYQG